MLTHFESPWVLDLDTGKIINVSNLYNWGDTYLQMSGWAATVDGFTVENPELESAFDIPEEHTTVTVDMKTLIEMTVANRVVELERDGDTLHRATSPH